MTRRKNFGLADFRIADLTDGRLGRPKHARAKVLRIDDTSSMVARSESHESADAISRRSLVDPGC